MSDANLAARRLPSGTRSCRVPPSPWNSITAGQPVAGGVPDGSISVQASFVPSEAVNGTSCVAAAGELAGHTRAPRAKTSRMARRTTNGKAYPVLRSALWTGGRSACSTPASVACPRLVPLIEGDDPYGEATEAAVREYVAPLKEVGVDTVILGCTHYPLIRPILQRVLGRAVTLVFSAEETATEAAETLSRKGIENDPGREGEYRFLTTADPAAFREMGRRFLQLPIGEVEHVTLTPLGAAA